MSSVQISAFISDSTREALERFAEDHGLKKGYIVEEALVRHLQALRELPADVMVPVRIVLSPAALARVAGRVRRPRRPTAEMKALMKGRGRS